MAIKRRKHKPSADAAPPPKKLEIKEGVKRPIPEGGRIRDVMGDNPSPSQVRRLGSIASSVHSPPDLDMTVEDRVTAIQTPLDKKNPQEFRYRARVRNRGTAITAFCITCLGGHKAVRECIDTTCPLWAFRFGSDPFYGNR